MLVGDRAALPAHFKLLQRHNDLLCALLAAAPAIAQRADVPIVAYSSGTLKRIDETRVVRLGYRENSPPFAFLDAKRRPIGYSLDICAVVVDEIIREVGKDLTVEYRAVTPENRFELVTSDAIDLECGSTTNTAERRKIVAFSPTMFVTGTKLLVRRGSGIRSLRDLDGKTIVLTGAMIPYAFGSSDGLFNLGSALSFAQVLPPGVYVAMNGQSFPWDRVRKNRERGEFEAT